MKMKYQITSKQLIVKLNRTLLVFLVLFGFQCCVSKQESIVLKHSSGNDEIDQIRREVRTHPSDASNYEYRGVMLKFWESSLQQQGAILDGRFASIGLRRMNITSSLIKKAKEKKIAKYSKIIDQGSKAR
jgi:hypothetical protein